MIKIVWNSYVAKSLLVLSVHTYRFEGNHGINNISFPFVFSIDLDDNFFVVVRAFEANIEKYASISMRKLLTITFQKLCILVRWLNFFFIFKQLAIGWLILNLNVIYFFFSLCLFSISCSNSSPSNFPTIIHTIIERIQKQKPQNSKWKSKRKTIIQTFICYTKWDNTQLFCTQLLWMCDIAQMQCFHIRLSIVSPQNPLHFLHTNEIARMTSTAIPFLCPEQGSKEHNSQQMPQVEEKIFTDDELTQLIDPILKMDDTSNDGYIDYPEFIRAQQKAAAGQHQQPHQQPSQHL